MDSAELAAETGNAWRMIGDHRRAADCADQAVRQYGTAYPRSAQLNTVHRAQAALQLGELDQALHLARSAVPTIKTLTSARAVHLVKTFDTELDPHVGEPQVRRWREYLHTELPTAAA